MFLLKFARITRELSQGKLARLIGTSHSVISNIETGRVNPNERERKALAKVLGVSPDDLLKHVDATLLGDGAEFLDAQREAKS